MIWLHQIGRVKKKSQSPPTRGQTFAAECDCIFAAILNDLTWWWKLRFLMEFCNASDRMHCVQNLNNSSLQQQDHNHLKETQCQTKPGKESPSCQQFQKWRCCKQFCCHHDCISAEGMHCISPSVFVALVCLKGVEKKEHASAIFADQSAALCCESDTPNKQADLKTQDCMLKPRLLEKLLLHLSLVDNCFIMTVINSWKKAYCACVIARTVPEHNWLQECGGRCCCK